MNKKNRFIAFSIAYWLLFLCSTGIILKLYFAGIPKMVFVYDFMGVTIQMPLGLRDLLFSLNHWWAYVAIGIIIYLGTISKLRRYSVWIHCSALAYMTIVTAGWLWALYWLEYVLPTIK